MQRSRCEVAWIKRHKKLFPVAVMCRSLKVSTSGYYDSIKRKPCRQHIRRQSIAQAAVVSYFESNRVYGYRKVYKDVAEKHLCCKETVRRIMSDIGLFSRIKRKIVVTTNSEHALAITENILGRNFTANRANHK